MAQYPANIPAVALKTDADITAALAPIVSTFPDADYLVIFDGGSKGNPGRGYGSYMLVAQSRSAAMRKAGTHYRWRRRTADFGNNQTNNMAEYQALLHGLDDVTETLAQHDANPRDYTIVVLGDSELVVKQLRGEYRVKDEKMQQYYSAARDKLDRFKDRTIRHHDRAYSVQLLGH